MDWASVFLIAPVFFFCSFVSVLLGVRWERQRRDAEVDAWEIPEERLSNGAYWKKRYEELVDEDELFMAALVKETKLEGMKDARRKTT